MTHAIRRATSLRRAGAARFEGVLDTSWYQGRGAFGGLLAGAILDAMGEVVADEERAPRSLTVHFCAPASAGPFELAVEGVRAGSRVTHVEARLSRDGEVTTMATASFCKTRDAAVHYARASMPEVEPPTTVPEVPRGLPGLPAFFEHVDVRFCGPTMPFSGADRPEVAAWVRLRAPEAASAANAALLVDVLPPAVSATLAAPRPLASVDFTVRFFARFPLVGAAPDEHLLVAIGSRWAADGYTEELRDLWSPRGELLAECRQLIALL